MERYNVNKNINNQNTPSQTDLKLKKADTVN